jgi:hypothetical protein
MRHGKRHGRLTTMSDPAGASTYCYERRGLLALEEEVEDPAAAPALRWTAERRACVR